jgi:solute carrier family 6 amino acid transporter-like protein 5/7/9/14
MLGFYPNLFWRLCLKYITPGLMTVIVIYTLWNFEIPKDGQQDYPQIVTAIGWCLAAIGLIQVPIFAFHKIYHRKDKTFIEVICNLFQNPLL